MQHLNSTNSNLKKEVSSLAKELSEVDEFREIMEKPHFNGESFHEKRIDLLKA
jgi:hypothetical protein